MTDAKLDKKSKILISFFLLALLSLFIFNYNKFIVNEDYKLFAIVSCNPKSESCFINTCEDCDDSSYKIIITESVNAPDCDPIDCPEVECNSNNIGDCITIHCSDENIENFDIEGYCSDQQ